MTRAEVIGSLGLVWKSKEASRRATATEPRLRRLRRDAANFRVRARIAALDDAGGGAESHANADFLGLASDGIRDDAVDAEGGEDRGRGRQRWRRGRRRICCGETEWSTRDWIGRKALLGCAGFRWRSAGMMRGSEHVRRKLRTHDEFERLRDRRRAAEMKFRSRAKIRD